MTKLMLAILLLAACQRPSMKSRMKALSTKVGAIAAVVRPKVTVDVDAAAMLAAAQQQQQRQPQQEPAPQRGEPPRDRPAPMPDPIVKRTVAPPPSYVLRGETMGGKKICTKWTSFDECNADCTRQIRAAAMAALAKDAGATKSCVCVEASGC